MKLKDIFEGFFHPEAAKRTDNSAPHSAGPKGPSTFPYTEEEETLSDEEIGKELKLELKLGNVMKDPRNLPGHNVHNGSFANGKASKPFGNYQTNSKQTPDPSQVDVAVRPIEESEEVLQHDPELEELTRKIVGAREVEESSKTSPEVQEMIDRRNAARDEAVKARKTKRGTPTKWEDAKSYVQKEDVGMREKGRAYGAQITTKQPLASGVPNQTGSEFMDDDEIAHELGLMEWISSSRVFNQHAHGPEAELDFFDKNRPAFAMTTEQEFNENQRKRTKNGKTKKSKNSGR